MSKSFKNFIIENPPKIGTDFTVWEKVLRNDYITYCKAEISKTVTDDKRASLEAKTGAAAEFNTVKADDWRTALETIQARKPGIVMNISDFLTGSLYSESPLNVTLPNVIGTTIITPPVQNAIIPTNLNSDPRTKSIIDVKNTYRAELSAYISTLSADEQKVFNETLDSLIEANGQDAYSNESLSVGRLKVEEYLALPDTNTLPRIEPKDVGDYANQSKFKAHYLAQVYLLNKRRAPTGIDAVKYGLIRMEAVKLGWVDGQKEIIYLPEDKDALKVFMDDIKSNKDFLSLSRTIAFLVPIFAEHVFRVFGHHYLSSDAQTYDTKYDQLASSCLVPFVSTTLPKSVMFHHVLHWVSPGRAYKVLRSQMDQDRIPEAMKTRASAAPAGTALITTTDAVLKAMEATGIYGRILEVTTLKLQPIRDQAAAIRLNPAVFHKVPHAYDLPELSESDKKSLDLIRDAATKIAPITQGFIDAMYKDAPLGKAKALLKHAQESPIQRKMASKFFKNLAKKNVVDVADLFVGSLDLFSPPKIQNPTQVIAP